MSTSTTTAPAVTPTPRSWSAPAVVAAAGFGVFALATVVAGALDPGYSPVREGVSALAATPSPSAPIMIGGFLALAAATVAAGVALWIRLPSGVAGRIGAALVVLAGLGMVVAGVNQQDCSDFVGACAAAEAAGTLSDHHVLHQLVSLAVFVALTIATLPLARGLRRNGERARFAVAVRLVGLVDLLLIVAMVVVGLGDVAGLVQRLLIALLFGLPVVLAPPLVRR